MNKTDEEVMERARANLRLFTKRLVEDHWNRASYHKAYYGYLAEGCTPEIAETKAMDASK